MKRLASFALAFMALCGAAFAQVSPTVPYVSSSDTSPGALNQTIANVNTAFAQYGAPITGPIAPDITKPCDIYAAAGTPCVAAHSLWRKMVSSYTGPLFKIVRTSDSTAMLVYPTTSGLANTASADSFCAETVCKVTLIYDQMHTATSGNNLPQATLANAGVLTFVSSQFGPIPKVNIHAGEYYRNRTSTVSMPVGNVNITAYMLVDTSISAACCGTYGDVEATVANTGGGHMFAPAYSTGAAGINGVGLGPWAGIDFENGVFMYGPTVTGPFMTILGKYNQSGNSWTLRTAPNVQPAFSTLHTGTPPYTGAFEGGISLGEGGDGSVAPVSFFEGAVIASYSADATDDNVQAGIKAVFSGVNPSLAPVACTPADQANNLVTSPLSYTSFSSVASATIASATDPTGGSNGISVTGAGSSISSAQQVITLTGGLIYTETLLVKGTSSATVFPGTSIVFNSSGTPEVAAVINTNNGQLVKGQWGGLDASYFIGATSSYSSGWWTVKMQVQAPPGATSATLYIDSPVANSTGTRGTQTPGLVSTFYCPLLRAGAF